MQHCDMLACLSSPPTRYCEEKFIQKYVPTIGIDYGVKPFKLGDYEVSACHCLVHAPTKLLFQVVTFVQGQKEMNKLQVIGQEASESTQIGSFLCA